MEQGPREVVDPKVDMTLMKIRAVIRAKPRYHPYFAAIRKRCIDDQLEYYDLYDMPPAEVNRILGVVGDFSRVLLKNAVDEANAVLEKGKGFTCEVCHQPFPYIERLRSHEISSMHEIFRKAAVVKREVVVDDVQDIIDLEVDNDVVSARVKEEEAVLRPGEGNNMTVGGPSPKVVFWVDPEEELASERPKQVWICLFVCQQ